MAMITVIEGSKAFVVREPLSPSTSQQVVQVKATRARPGFFASTPAVGQPKNMRELMLWGVFRGLATPNVVEPAAERLVNVTFDPVEFAQHMVVMGSQRRKQKGQDNDTGRKQCVQAR